MTMKEKLKSLISVAIVLGVVAIPLILLITVIGGGFDVVQPENLNASGCSISLQFGDNASQASNCTLSLNEEGLK